MKTMKQHDVIMCNDIIIFKMCKWTVFGCSFVYWNNKGILYGYSDRFVVVMFFFY